jgi:poly-beta-1,6-N-acetyl-D-glucosamine synthase
VTAPALLPAYVIVTPVRDEARFIADTIATVLAQNHLPLRWVIVDDGSTDQTPQILHQLTCAVPWVSVVSTGSTARKLGSAEVLAFQRGAMEIEASLPYQYIVKLDGDVRLPTDYFACLLLAMSARPRWGIGSGVFCESDDGDKDGTAWHVVSMPDYHAAGASKVVQRDCFEQIGGFVARKGWDTVDEIRAGLLGWHTGHVAELQFQHLKPEGQAMGSLSTHAFHGDIYYQTGGGLLFLLAKVLRRMQAGRPRVLGGLAMLGGYLRPLLQRQPRLVSAEEAQFYRALLNRRLTKAVRRVWQNLLGPLRLRPVSPQSTSPTPHVRHQRHL